MVDTVAIRRKRRTILQLFGEIALNDVDYLNIDELEARGEEGDIEDEEAKKDEEDEEDEGDSEGETIGSDDWSLEESDDDSQERRDLGDFIVDDNWGEEESDSEYIEGEEDPTLSGDAESWGGDNSEISKDASTDVDEEAAVL